LKKTILAPGILELILEAPAAAQTFEPGQFFRLQTLSHSSPMEALALTGAGVDRAKGTLSLIILDSGVSSRAAWSLKEGAALSLMGPTGAPTHLPENKKVVLVGGGLGNAVLFSIARALKARGCTVLYCAGYKNASSLFKREEIEDAACQVYWSTQEGDPIQSTRPGDLSLPGTVVDLLAHIRHNSYQTVLKGAPDFLLAIGSAPMMEAVQKVTGDPFYENTQTVAGLNTPMHCMMKGICGTCVQAGRDEHTGKAYLFLACINQDQPLHSIDFEVLKGRLRQNEVQEVLNYYWINGQETPSCHRS
jgi:NAD(P)H-flavin reductase